MQLGNDDETNIEDRRGEGGGGGGGGGMRVGMPLGIGGTVVVLALSLLFKRNLFNDLGTPVAGPGPGQGSTTARDSPEGRAREAQEAGLRQVAVRSFNDVQSTWAATLPRSGAAYRPAHLVMFWDSWSSACGGAAAAMGPFYCPADQKVYNDLGFYRELAQRFGAPGQFAQAYVLAHEVGHHIQNLLGIEAKVRQAQRVRPSDRNHLSVLMELQADCFAGVWGHAAQQRGVLAPGDVEQGLRAAAAVGDDRLQKAATGRVSPESFTHGSAAQRSHWFRRGFDSGRVADCDTFAAGADGAAAP